MESLSREQVMHVANLGRININEDEIEKFGYGLKQILNEIDKISKIDIETEDIMISPTDNVGIYRQDEENAMLSTEDALKNAPKTKGNFIEVVRVIND
ncbi:MAG TPA: Asp-tRNA(Asn)/Glu-tRNA(Gln) amidotransferase subunit GatC [Mollicutes bacterium]|nr:Asp-tRNA(Asn)/Glu-tRNA(Gln) amidotransferase subunit GatC [Mollicutes bacterium]